MAPNISTDDHLLSTIAESEEVSVGKKTSSTSDSLEIDFDTAEGKRYVRDRNTGIHNKNVKVNTRGNKRMSKRRNEQSPFPYIPIDITELGDNLGYVVNALSIKNQEQVFMYLIDKINEQHINKTRSLTHFMSQMKFTPYLQHLIETIEDENYLALVWENPGSPLSEILAASSSLVNSSRHNIQNDTNVHSNNTSPHLDSNRNIDSINKEQTFKSFPTDISQDLDFRKIFCQVCWGLANLHENNLAHMNINLDTIWVKRVVAMKDGKHMEESEVRIVDFSSLGHFITTNPVHMHAWFNRSNRSSNRHVDDDESFDEYRNYGAHDENSYDIFVAPEIMNKQPCWGWRPDVWSLGVVLYFVITRNFPCNGDYRRFHREIMNGEFEYPEEMDPDAINLLKQMWNPDPTKKFDMWDVKKHTFLSPPSTHSCPSVSASPSAPASSKASFESEVRQHHKNSQERNRSSYIKNMMPKNVLRKGIFVRFTGKRKNDCENGDKDGHVDGTTSAVNLDLDPTRTERIDKKQKVKSRKREAGNGKKTSSGRESKKRIGKEDGRSEGMRGRVKHAVKKLANICHPEATEPLRIVMEYSVDEGDGRDVVDVV